MSDASAALSELGAIARANPRDPVAWYRWALALARAGQRPAALQAVRSALPLASRAAQAVGMGKLFEILEQPAEALAAYRRATQLEPSHVESQVCLAALLTRVGDPRAATLSLRAALGRTPGSAELEAELAEALLATGHHAEALEHARRAGELGMPPELTHGLRARILEAQGKPAASLSELGQLSGYGIEDANTLVGTARQLIAAGDNPGALAALERAAKAAPPDPMLRLAIGEAILAAGAAPSAQAVLRQAVQLAPESAAAHLALGRALRRSGLNDEAVAALRTAVRLDPNDAQALAELATLLGQLGELEDAAHLLVRAASLAPDDEDIRDALARALATAPKRRPASSAPQPAASSLPPDTSMQPSTSTPPTISLSQKPKRQSAPGGIVSDLAMFSLPELLEFLLNQRATGTLSLRSEAQEAALELFEGNLAGARWPGGRRLADLLVERRIVGMDDLVRLLGDELPHASDPSVASAIVKGGLAPKPAVHEVVTEQLKDALLLLVPWREGQAVFHRVAKGTVVAAPEIIVETRWGLMETIRLLDEGTRDSEPPIEGHPSFDPLEGI